MARTFPNFGKKRSIMIGLIFRTNLSSSKATASQLLLITSSMIGTMDTMYKQRNKKLEIKFFSYQFPITG